MKTEKTIGEKWGHLLSNINFAQSHLDAESIQYLNEISILLSNHNDK